MLSKLFSIKSSILSLEISANSVILTELAQKEGQYQLVNYATEALPIGHGDLVDLTQQRELASAMERLCSKISARKRQIAMSVPDSKVITKIVQIPVELNQSEILAYLEVNAEDYFSHPLDELSFDFKVLGASDSQESSIDLLLVICRRETVLLYQELAKKVNLQLRFLAVRSHALARACYFSHSLSLCASSQPAVLLELQAGAVIFHTLERRYPIYSHEESFAGEMNEAERSYSRLLDYIERGLNFLYSSNSSRRHEIIFLLGSFPKEDDFIGLMKIKFNCQVQFVKPFSNVAIADHLDKSKLAKDEQRFVTNLGVSLLAEEHGN